MLPQRSRLHGEEDFRWRGGDVSRIEGLSDGVFALCMTLLVVSLEVPGTFGELLALFEQVPAFAACFALLLWIWLVHFRFHRRFGLEDAWTKFLNAALLFVVLLYVYPLRFLAGILFHRWFGLDSGLPTPEGIAPLVQGDVPGLMLLYGGGFSAIFLLCGLMNLHAWRLRRELQLDARELLLTRAALFECGISVALGLASIALVLAQRELAPWAGALFFLMGPLQAANGIYWGRRVVQLRG